jgi:hypothetical protein
LLFTALVAGTSFSLKQKNSVIYKSVKITKLQKYSYTIIHVPQPPFWVAQKRIHQLHIYPSGQHIINALNRIAKWQWCESILGCVHILLWSTAPLFRKFYLVFLLCYFIAIISAESNEIVGSIKLFVTAKFFQFSKPVINQMPLASCVHWMCYVSWMVYMK